MRELFGAHTAQAEQRARIVVLTDISRTQQHMRARNRSARTHGNHPPKTCAEKPLLHSLQKGPRTTSGAAPPAPAKISTDSGGAGLESRAHHEKVTAPGLTSGLDRLPLGDVGGLAGGAKELEPLELADVLLPVVFLDEDRQLRDVLELDVLQLA